MRHFDIIVVPRRVTERLRLQNDFPDTAQPCRFCFVPYTLGPRHSGREHLVGSVRFRQALISKRNLARETFPAAIYRPFGDSATFTKRRRTNRERDTLGKCTRVRIKRHAVSVWQDLAPRPVDFYSFSMISHEPRVEITHLPPSP